MTPFEGWALGWVGGLALFSLPMVFLMWRDRRRRARRPEQYPRRLLVIPGPSITADDWDGPNLKPGVLERFDAELAALADRLRQL